jgi:hypothetical protein
MKNRFVHNVLYDTLSFDVIQSLNSAGVATVWLEIQNIINVSPARLARPCELLPDLGRAVCVPPLHAFEESDLDPLRLGVVRLSDDTR